MSRKRKQGDPRRAVGYVRVSTEDQTLGATAQREAIEGWCRGRQIDLVALREDVGVSGTIEAHARPGLCAALDDLRVHGAGILVALRRDRWARDALVAEALRRSALAAGAALATVDGGLEGQSPSDLLVANILDSAAAYERRMIAARTSAALRTLQRSGRAAGGFAPYGYRVAPGGELEIDPGELAAVARMRELAGQGLTYEAIRRHMEAEGHPSRSGRWHRQTVRRALARVDLPHHGGGLSQSA